MKKVFQLLMACLAILSLYGCPLELEACPNLYQAVCIYWNGTLVNGG